MINSYAIYLPDGTIVKNVMCQEADLSLNMDEGQAYLLCQEIIDCGKYYVRDGSLCEKMEFPPVNITAPQVVNSLITVSGIPPGTKVIWPDWYESEESTGELSFEAKVGGDYLFQFYHPEYVTKRMFINVA